MTFEEAYAELEKEFSRRVDEDKRCWGFESIFLPNLRPKSPVDFVLVGMEPSLRGWAKDLQEARDKIDCGFRNFFGFDNYDDYPKDADTLSVLFFCISEYLCPAGETYHLTDLALGAMKPNTEGAGHRLKYEAWFPMFQKELGLVAKRNAKIISIGTKVRDFLAEKGLYGHVGSIPHYSRIASRHWGKEILGREKEFCDFAKGVSKLPGGTELTITTKKLMFDYKIAFERIRAQDESGWLGWQRKWQSRLT